MNLDNRPEIGSIYIYNSLEIEVRAISAYCIVFSHEIIFTRAEFNGNLKDKTLVKKD